MHWDNFGCAVPCCACVAHSPINRPGLFIGIYDRDFSFLVEEKIEAEKIVLAAKKTDPKFITDVKVFDIFTGKTVEGGKKSVAINVTLQPTKKTLTDSEIEMISGAIVKNVKKHTGGILR